MTMLVNDFYYMHVTLFLVPTGFVFTTMALSPYFNLDFNQTPNSEMSTFHDQGTPQVLVAPEHHHLLYHHHHHQDDSFFLPNTLFDSYFDPTSTFLYPEIYHNLLPYDPIISLSDIFPTTEDHHCNLLPCPKRQKCFHEEHDNSSINTFDGFVPNPLPAEEPVLPLPELLFSDPPMPEFQVPQLPHARSFGAYDDDHFQYDQYEKKIKGKITISAQSVAARERRRKITEKTQELGKLVPGGCRMNTAEMLHAAGKYVQYMQAQVQILQLMNTLQVIN